MDLCPISPDLRLDITTHYPVLHNTHPHWAFCYSNLQGYSHPRAFASALLPVLRALPPITGSFSSFRSQTKHCQLIEPFQIKTASPRLLVYFLYCMHITPSGLYPSSCPSPNYKLPKIRILVCFVHYCTPVSGTQQAFSEYLSNEEMNKRSHSVFLSVKWGHIKPPWQGCGMVQR